MRKDEFKIIDICLRLEYERGVKDFTKFLIDEGLMDYCDVTELAKKYIENSPEVVHE